MCWYNMVAQQVVLLQFCKAKYGLSLQVSFTALQSCGFKLY